jgi:hypothetical protein
MTLGRMIRFIALFVIVLSVWSYMNHVGHSMSHVRDDLLGRTRFLIRQARSGDAETMARLAARYRRPADDVPPLPVDFGELWPVLREGEAGSAAYAEAAAPASSASTVQRRVVFRGKDEKGQPATVQLDWVRVDGKWYVEGWQVTART